MEMYFRSLSIFPLLLCILPNLILPAFSATTSPYTPTDYILLDCGSESNNTAFDGRQWQADTLPNSLPNSLISNASERPSSIPYTPYMTARIFLSEFTYSFLVSSGSKFLRLHFYPATYNQTFNKTTSFFSVTANQYTLLSNFSAFLAVSYIKPYSATLIKEYIININDTHQQLSITFLPNFDSYAFINGIEIVSIPNDLYFKGENVPLTTSIAPYYLKSYKALETLYRLNVGGAFVQATGDTGMFRAWSPDDDYVLSINSLTASRNVEVNYTSSDPAYTAPETVYTSARFMSIEYGHFYNMTWVFPVDSGFDHLLRLHFCQFFLDILQPGDMIFSIFINNQTVEIDADVITWAKGPVTAVSKDYVAYATDTDGHDLFLTLKTTTPDILFVHQNAILNGLEIFKISLLNGTLNSPNHDPASLPEHIKIKIWLIILAAGIVSLVVAFLGILIFKKCKILDDTASRLGNHDTKLIVNSICRHFSFDEIKRATCNLDDKFVIGVGGFGSVYKGYINNGLDEVAIKRLNPSSNQGISEFQTEIEMLSKLRHLHLVSLIGYCQEKGEMILVYDYMSRGTLRDHLYNTQHPHLPWKQRLQICVGIARGLHYLHTSSGHTIIHRDIKSTNILLDENWVAKVSDFGISKIGPTSSGSKFHISTMVKGSFGYLDPEYFLTQRLTDKSDVYSFGVVLLEVLCACPAITQDKSGEHISLVDWAHSHNKEGTLDQIIDQKMKGEIASNCLSKYVEITFKCLDRKGAYRPASADVVWNLEYALQLQEDDEENSSFKMNMENYEAAPSGPIVHQRMGEPDNSYTGFSNVSLTLVR